MADVTLTYKGSTILSMDATTSKTIKTGGKFCEGDISVNYVSPKINRNLLDNWYFVGGGSQLGDGVFPINQRGQITYNSAGYRIDRWKYNKSNGKLTVNSDYITWETQTTSQAVLEQSIENPEKLFGKTVTLSALMADGRLVTGSGVVPTSFPASGQTNVVYPGPWTIALVYSSRKIGFAQILANPTTRMVSAIKLELGSEQTLAHNEGTEENPVWVLNEVPDYGEELRKCQRYYQLFRTASLRPTYGEDCRPTMATEQPTKGTLTKGGVTYYTLSSES